MAHSIAAPLMAACLLLSSSCKKEASPAADMGRSVQALPLATNVIDALNRKDYNGAVAALLKVKAAVSTAPEQTEFMVLTRELRSKLLEASATDPKAAQALNALRVISGGR